MKNKFLISTSAMVLAFAFANAANAGCDGVYLAARGGMAKQKVDMVLPGGDKLNDDNVMLSGALGYRYGYLRTELEYVWRDTLDKKSAYGASYEFETSSYMWNTYWDLSPYTWFTPYLSAGIGVTKIKYDHKTVGLGTFTFEHKKFTWQLGGGLSAQITNRFNIDVGYRFFNFGNFQRAKTTSHEIYGGVRYVF